MNTEAASFVVIAVEDGTARVLTDAAFTARQRDAIGHMIRHRGVDPLPPPAEPDRPAPSPTDRVAQAGAARMQGYTGDACTSCLSFRMKRNGSCTVCDDCGQTTGCS